jgi:hypothetical protein
MARKESETMNKQTSSNFGNLPGAGPGRPKGSVNKATQGVREMISMVAEQNAPKFAEWLNRVAEGDEKNRPDPGKAAELYLKAIEYHIPKLARTEVSGTDGGPIETVIKWASEKS